MKFGLIFSYSYDFSGRLRAPGFLTPYMSNPEARIINLQKLIVMSETPNYYAVIPAFVRYDEQLPAGAKLMYGEITALSNKKGYCFASNGYFSKLYKCTPQAISKWIQLLRQRGYVEIEYVGVLGNQERRVSIHVAGYQPQLIPLSTGVEGVSTTVEHNNTSNNSTSSNKRGGAPKKPPQKKFKKPTLEEVYAYMLQKTENENIARREAEKFHDHFESNGWKVSGKAKMKDWKASSRNWLRRDFSKYNRNGKTTNQNGKQFYGAQSEENVKRTLAILRSEGRA